MQTKYKVRLYPDGVKEVLVEGSIEDVLKILNTGGGIEVKKKIDIEEFCSMEKGYIIPRKSIFEILEAILFILYAYKLEGIIQVTGIKLSKCLKKAGYRFDRLDRVISENIKQNLCTSTGTKRNIKYTLTKKGLNYIEKILYTKNE